MQIAPVQFSRGGMVIGLAHREFGPLFEHLEHRRQVISRQVHPLRMALALTVIAVVTDQLLSPILRGPQAHPAHPHRATCNFHQLGQRRLVLGIEERGLRRQLGEGLALHLELMLAIEHQLGIAVRPQALHHQQRGQKRREPHDHQRHHQRPAVIIGHKAHKIRLQRHGQNGPVTPHDRLQRRSRADIALSLDFELPMPLAFDPKPIEGPCEHGVAEFVQSGGLQLIANPFKRAVQIRIRD